MIKKTFLILLSVSVFVSAALADEGFGDLFDDDQSEEAYGSISLTGAAGLELCSYMDDGWESELSISPYMVLEVQPASDRLEAMLRLDIDSGVTELSSEIIDELYLRCFFNFGYIETGLMKVEWGKGDGYHVLDPLNPLNQSGGITDDLNEMKDAVAMVKLNLYTGASGLLELVYIPVFSGHTVADSGRWALIDPSMLPNLTTDAPEGLSGFSAAARYTSSLGPLDFGLQYYYGYIPEPGYRFETIFTGTEAAQMADPAYWVTNTALLYTRAHILGIEAGAAAGPFTFRAEFGGRLTEDSEGTLPEYWNSELVALAGFDVTIPGTNLFFSIQAAEEWVWNYEDRGETDVNTAAAYDNKATATTVIPAVKLPFGRDKYNISFAGMYIVEAEGWMALPSFEWSPSDDYVISLSGQFFGGEKDSYFKTWEDNGNISLEFEYTF